MLYWYMDIYICVRLEKHKNHDINVTPDMGTLNVTDTVSQWVSDTPGTRDAYASLVPWLRI